MVRNSTICKGISFYRFRTTWTLARNNGTVNTYAVHCCNNATLPGFGRRVSNGTRSRQAAEQEHGVQWHLQHSCGKYIAVKKGQESGRVAVIKEVMQTYAIQQTEHQQRTSSLTRCTHPLRTWSSRAGGKCRSNSKR